MNQVRGVRSRKFRFKTCWLAALGALIFGPFVSPSEAEGLRPLSATDLSRLQGLGDGFGSLGALSPDGKWLAYVIQRPKAGNFHQEPFLAGGDRADVWVVPTPGGTPKNLTQGESDGSGSWSPEWSPDSQHIAFLSTKGSGPRTVHLWMCDPENGTPRQLTPGGVDLLFPHRFVWLSNHELIAARLADGEKPESMSVEMQTGEIAMKQWPKSWQGNQPTVSVLQSGIAPHLEDHPQIRLMVIDIDGGERELFGAPGVSDLIPSPSGNYLAVLEQTGISAPTGGPIAWASLGTYSLKVFDQKGNAVALATGDVKHILQGSLKWSADSNELALAQDPADVAEGGAAVLRCRVQAGLCEPVGAGLVTAVSAARVQDANAAPFAWSAQNDFLLYAKKPHTTRSDWWLLAPGKDAKNLTASLPETQFPADLMAVSGGNSFVGVADKHVWSFSLDGSAPRNIAPKIDQDVLSIAWPQSGTPEGAAASEIIIAAGTPKSTSLYSITLSTGEVKPIARPADDSTFAMFSPKTRTLIFSSTNRGGNSLWTGKIGSDQFKEVVKLNAFLQGVAEGKMRSIDYNSLDGKPLKAWVILPVDYRDGTRYPVITWVYAGSMMSPDKEPFLSRLNDPIALNMQLFAAHGFAVLFPSMPLTAEGVASDPLLDLTNGVLPAVDKVVELGIGDTERVGLIGQSYGGFSTYGLITQTHRFHAAASLAGLSDLFSLYGQFDARERYTGFPHELPFMMWLFENGQGRLGQPPWQNLGRYLRNSPIFYVERVETPLMIVQGDMDYVAMQQGEEFFNALYRQGKRAEFLRYWGEGHVLESPANIADLWQKLFAWFDEFLVSPPHSVDVPKKN